MASEELTDVGGEKLAAIVALHALDRDTKLGEYISEETVNSRGGVGLLTKWKRPGKM